MDSKEHFKKLILIVSCLRSLSARIKRITEPGSEVACILKEYFKNSYILIYAVLKQSLYVGRLRGNILLGSSLNKQFS